MALITDINQITKDLENATRKEVYQKVKATIDAANKRLKRQGVDVTISTRGKDIKGLIDATKQALNVQAKRQKPRNVIEQLHDNIVIQNTKTEIKQSLHQLPNDFRRMSRSELYKAVRPTIDAANKRLKRLESSEILSPAYSNVIERGGKFSTAGLDRNELIREASRAISFMNMETSTLKGAKQYENNLVSKLSNKAKSITQSQRKVLFDAFRKLEQISPQGLNLYGSDRLIRMLGDSIVDSGLSFDEMMNNAINELNQAYEENIKDLEDDIDIWDL